MSDKRERLSGRVAAILNARELAINIGRAQGVQQGMKFAVLAETPLVIVDPETGKPLDAIDREKVRVEASEVRDRMSICRTYRVTRTLGLLDLSAIADARLRASREIEETLRIEDDSTPPPLSEEESYVKINDRVVEVDD